MTIYTIGTSRRSKEEFIEILESYRIQHICDVRRFPISRFQHFNRKVLELSLEQRGISYTYLGDLLGGFRKEGYEVYMGQDTFRKGVDLLLDIAGRESACILCAERLPWRCHRRFIAKYVQGRGVEVVHIIERGRLWKG